MSPPLRKTSIGACPSKVGLGRINRNFARISIRRDFDETESVRFSGASIGRDMSDRDASELREDLFEGLVSHRCTQVADVEFH